MHLNDFEWLRSETLQTNLEYLQIKLITIAVGLPNYQNVVPINYTAIQNLNRFQKLGIIQISNSHLLEYMLRNDTSIKAFICEEGINRCEFEEDINNRTCPNDCKCTLDREDMRFKIECNTSEYHQEIPELPIPIIGNTSLYFNNANLTKLPTSNLYGYSQVKELYLANNQLSHLAIDQLPENLTYLDIRNNSLQSIDKSVLEFLAYRSRVIQILLSGNPWICHCENEHLIIFVQDPANKIVDRKNILCGDVKMGRMTNIFISSICNSLNDMNMIIIGVSFGIIVVIIIVICVITIHYKQLILMWLFERNLCVSCIAQAEPDNDLKYDAFLAFSHQDLEFVEIYVEKLERGPCQYQLYFYHRDWLIGECIPDCILRSIEDSKRIIILLTENFMKSSWGRFEFRCAIQATSTNKYKRLIVIVYPGIDFNDLDIELRNYMKFNTYLTRDDPQFWRKLMFGMPHKEQTVHTCEESSL
ncbi:protein toll-like [Drosophila sulfurigaster albostrigata]|uniref:protein toll-like n=1 Tax=Drosophila sulfurigaster albostrigata TaxID=89887 RepID=UPI002D219EAA|nr:protein toll-like [Drosophila sulfurigaster albostrigata]